MGIQINGQTDNIKANDGGFTVSSNLEPSANNTYDLGSATNKWNNFYVNAIINSDTSGSGTVPIGSVFYFASSTRPDGYLVCNGAINLNTYTYRNLHSVISNTFGGTAYQNGTTNIPTATTTFSIPDLRGEFIRGWDGGRGVDSSRVFGTAQNASRINTTSAMNTIADNTENPENQSETRYSYSGPFTSTRSMRQIRPRNVALLPCIKY